MKKIFRTPLIIYTLSLLPVIAMYSCIRPSPLLKEISSSHSGITFRNTITESDSVNQLDNGNIYNGGGTGIGDFNNDGLPDIFFTGNLVPCRLYINRGDFRFDDVTEKAGVSGNGKWCRGVAVVDINNDGLQDIYVSCTLSRSVQKRKNLLYINNGPDKNGIPSFTESAAAYHLDDDSHTTQAVFFDYDNDGDLDVYLVVNEVNDRNSPYLFKPMSAPAPGPGRGKLLRNDMDPAVGHPVFTDVTAEAGIGTEGFGNQATVTDINMDGWKDIYVSNDYLTPDLLWINNHDGTFTESLSHYFRHTSNSAMGNDAADINNDGLIDFFTLDMNPEDNYRKKMMLLPSSYQFYQNSDRYGYNYQYTRNTLQLNQGNRLPGKSGNFDPVFSEISYFAGVEASDWSWCTLLTDFNNDGYNDIFIANGFPKDVTDRDFGMYRSAAWLSTPKMEILKQIPEVKIHNYIYRNNGNLTFTNMSAAWGLSKPTFSNGAATADLDLDGDEDLVVNNINDEASLYRNMSRENDKAGTNFLSVELKGNEPGQTGIGAFVEIFYNGDKKQIREVSPYKGYLSTSSTTIHFGLGKINSIDSLKVTWQGGKTQTISNPGINKFLTINEKDAISKSPLLTDETESQPVFRDITKETGIDFVHEQNDYVDFNIQKLIPHKFSEYAPALAAGDINGDGLDDLIIGGSANHTAQIFIQQHDGKFRRQPLSSKTDLLKKTWDDMGIVLFDADGDGDNDLYIASGGYENEDRSPAFKDHFYLNDGKGNFTENSDLLPANPVSKGCVRAVDFDNDGDMDLFVSGRVKPWSYPQPVSSFLYRNDSKNGKIVFTDITSEAAPELNGIGMICDAVFTDFDNDGWTDLVLAGEWQPLIFMKNENGKYRNITQTTGTEKFIGWWNSIVAGDFDNDGDIDFVAGNLGLNTFFRASDKHPVSVYGKDFDNNGSYDAFISLWLLSNQTDTTFGDYPMHGRDDLIKQMLSMRAKFPTFRSLATSTIDKLFSPEQLKGATILKSNEFRSALFRNEGNGRFSFNPLPVQAQLSALNGMVADDFDGDGNTDLLINTNDYSTEVLTGRYDALSGLVLKGTGQEGFSAMSIAESGIFIPGNGRALVRLLGADGSYRVAASQNRGPLKIFQLDRKVKTVACLNNETRAVEEFEGGKTKQIQLTPQTSFMSQSSGFITAPEGLSKVTFITNTGARRPVVLIKTKNKDL